MNVQTVPSLATGHPAGGGFLVQDDNPEEIFTPEDFSSDHKMFAKTARDFMEREVMPVSDRIEAKDLELLTGLVRKAGEVGLLMVDVPEAYGGLSLDMASAALVAESLSGQCSFQVTLLTQTGIGTLPIVYYGTQEQKERYLPGLADGSLLGCYALTEPTAGSDALAARTRAVLSEDGTHYVLNGTKQFITNARISGVFTVFAKVDGEHFTAFLVDGGTEGLSFGPDEHKMGLRGSTTCTVNLEDVKVPVANVLGEIGKGHKIAFNILNIGRFKLGAVTVGAAKRALEHALAHCLERKQFGRHLAEFGAIREKLARMFVRIYAAEAATYRTVGLIDGLVRSDGGDHDARALRSIEEYSVECAMVKVLGSEALDFVVDEAVQCFGGYGYCAEYPVETFYRDSRINRIYEGTNEINRIIVPTMLLRKAAAGSLPLGAAYASLGEEPFAPTRSGTGGPLAAAENSVADLKKLCLLVLGRAAERYGKDLSAHQAVQVRIADLAMLAYAAESTVLRARKDVGRRGEGRAALPIAVAGIVCEEAIERGGALARQALTAVGADDAVPWLEALSRRSVVDSVGLAEEVAARLVDAERLVY